MTTDVLIIDYGMGNLGSVRRALEECGANVTVSHDPATLANASRIVLPGVGAFGDGVKNLRDGGWENPLQQAVIADKIPFLGICLGMQLLADRGFEGGDNPGLGLIPGEVKKLAAKSPDERIPHIGWNEITPIGDCPLFNGIPAGTDVYFVHSFHFVPDDSGRIAATTPYCGGFASAVWDKNIFGVQFHPEKSSKMGFRMLKNFLEI